jgi:hypothetical protein
MEGERTLGDLPQEEFLQMMTTFMERTIPGLVEDYLQANEGVVEEPEVRSRKPKNPL